MPRGRLIILILLLLVITVAGVFLAFAASQGGLGGLLGGVAQTNGNQGQEDTPRGTTEVDEEFGEPVSQVFQWHVEQWLVIDRQVHRLQEQEFFALEMTDHQCGVRAGRRRDPADGGPGEALVPEQPGSGRVDGLAGRGTGAGLQHAGQDRGPGASQLRVRASAGRSGGLS